MKTKSGLEDKRLLESLEFIDEKYISETMENYNDVPEVSGKPQTDKRAVRRTLHQVLALAACLVLLSAAIPLATNLIRGQISPIPPADGVGGESTPELEITEPPEIEEITTQPEPVYDGSRGLLYEVREDGVTAAFIGYGDCTDEIVYIASTYNGLPVVEMRNQPYVDAESPKTKSDYGSKYAKRIVVSDTVEMILGGVFDVCPNLESIYFGANMESINTICFDNNDGMNFASVEVSPDNKNFSDKGNCLVDLRTKELVLATPTTVIPDDGSVVIIGFYAFANARHGLTSIVIPEGVKVIDHGAFHFCLELESVVLPDSLEVIEIKAFGYCISLKTLELGTNLKSFNQNVFFPMYIPEIYYKGTVEQWEAVKKPLQSNKGDSFPVKCIDGESLSDVGDSSEYHWFLAPEYKAYFDLH